MSDLSVNAVELEEISPEIGETGSNIVPNNRLDLVGDVKVELSVELGKASVSVQDLFELKNNGILTLDTDIDSDITVFCNERAVAQGKLVVVENNFGIQITKVV